MSEQPKQIARVLVVDDERPVLEICEKILSGVGYEVRTASSVGEAMEKVDQEDMTVIISDIDMPDRTGFELAQELRARQQRLPCILMSGMGGPGTAKTAEIAGAAAFLDKPFTAPQLLAVLQKVLSRKDIMPA